MNNRVVYDSLVKKIFTTKSKVYRAIQIELMLNGNYVSNLVYGKHNSYFKYIF